jgi:DNA (cytosine-5)-methyltransferase 1
MKDPITTKGSVAAEVRNSQPKTRPQDVITRTMRSVRSKDTKPELVFRRFLWGLGLRYRVTPKEILGKPDIVFASKKVAVFVDGDFWHGNQWKKRGFGSIEEQFQHSDRADYWIAKIRRNVNRDLQVTQQLSEQGWCVLRFWESEIAQDLRKCARKVEMALGNLRDTTPRVCLDKSFAEFFAGIGLMRMGLERCGWQIRFANDIDPEKAKMYVGHFGEEESLHKCGDIHALSQKEIPSVTLATASFPCTDLSLAGSRAGLKGKHSSSYWGFVRLLEEMGKRRPPLVLLENVPAFLTSHNGNDFRDALLALNRLGYSVDSFIVNASNFVPQSRERLFVVGVQSPDQGINAVRESPSFFQSHARPKDLADFILLNSDIVWNVRPLPNFPQRKINLDRIVEHLDFDHPSWWNESRVQYLLNQMSPRHSDAGNRMIQEKKWAFGTVFRRVRNGRSMAELRTDGLAGCLRTPKGGSAKQILLMAGKGECHVRLLNPRECARLMGADDYRIDVSDNSALLGFGDAVCVPAIEWICRHYLDPVLTELIHGRDLIQDERKIAS